MQLAVLACALVLAQANPASIFGDSSDDNVHKNIDRFFNLGQDSLNRSADVVDRVVHQAIDLKYNAAKTVAKAGSDAISSLKQAIRNKGKSFTDALNTASQSTTAAPSQSTTSAPAQKPFGTFFLKYVDDKGQIT